MKTFFILSFLFLTIIQPVNASGPVGGPYTCDNTTTSTVEDGSPVTINWNVAGAANCTAGFDSGTAYPSTPNDGVRSAWLGSTRAGITGATLGTANTAPGTYTFTCRETSANKMGCAQLTVTCTAPKTWNGTTCALVPATCNLPWGGTIANGASATAYSASSVPFGSSCTSQTRTCTSGTLSGTYTNSSCVVDPAASCARPWGGSVAHGASVTAYQSPSVMSPATCTSQSRSCNNGTLSGTYTNQTCSVTSSDCTLPWGGTITTGNSVTAYSSSYVTSPATCASISETRTCTASVISGSYTNQTCSTLSGTLSANPTSCLIQAGDSTCPSTFTWTTTNPTAGLSQVRADDGTGPNSIFSNGASQSLDVKHTGTGQGDGQTFSLWHIVNLASATVDAKCTGTTAWDGASTCMLCQNGGCTNNVCNNGANNPPWCTTGSVMNGWLTATPLSCIIPTGASACNNDINLTWGVTNPVNYTAITLTPPVGSPEIPVAHDNPPGGMNVSVPFRYDINTGGSFPVKYFLYNNTVELGVQTINVSCAAGANKWDTINTICANPLVDVRSVVNDYGYVNPTGISFTCLDSSSWEVRRDPAGVNVIVNSGTYTTGQTVMQPLTLTGNYQIICKQGSVSDTTMLLYHSSADLPAPTMTINASPKTIDKGGKTTISWGVNFPPVTGCTLTASTVCANNDCTSDPSAVTAVATLNGIIANDNTDANDPSGPRSIISALMTPAQNLPIPKSMGRKTLDVSKSTNFTLDCNGNKASTLVRVTNSNEQ